ncbi:MAG: M60 family metallopeptidase, partial [Verrucomicrobiota bacterium]
AAPLYQHGKTQIDDWLRDLRKRPAPWAELASDRMVIALPSDHIRDLENPDEVMALWDEIIDTCAELSVVDMDALRAERIVFDRQTAAGSLHSGYPVAGHLGEHSKLAVDAERLRRDGFWGFFHEYGHNHQHNLWRLPGTGETTCNWWSVYCYEELIGKPRTQTHRAISPLSRLQTRNKYFREGANFEKSWAVWTALDTYLLIQEEFGWGPFKAVLNEYNELPRAEWPENQQEINDQWVIRLSRACGHNLAPYWQKWNLPMTDEVSKQLEDLPVWECEALQRY